MNKLDTWGGKIIPYELLFYSNCFIAYIFLSQETRVKPEQKKAIYINN